MAKESADLKRTRTRLAKYGISKNYVNGLPEDAIYRLQSEITGYINGRTVGNSGYTISKAEAKLIAGENMTTAEKKSIKECHEAGKLAAREAAKEKPEKKKKEKEKPADEKPREKKDGWGGWLYKTLFEGDI